MSFFSRLFGGRPKPPSPAAPAPPPAAPAPSAAPAPPAVPASPAADGTIVVDGLSYCPFAGLIAPAGQAGWSFPGKVEDRSKFSPPANEAIVNLKTTYGAYANLGGRNLLIVIDRASVQPGTKDWDFVHSVAKTLSAAYPALDAQAKAALAGLNAVIFMKSPQRSFASVAGGWFFYDTDEFTNATPSFAASNIVHDANHVWLFRNHKPHVGDAAEIICWQLQVDNQAALGLQGYEVDYLKKLIGDPATSKQRMDENP
jgi:hypothetical protein